MQNTPGLEADKDLVSGAEWGQQQNLGGQRLAMEQPPLNGGCSRYERLSL